MKKNILFSMIVLIVFILTGCSVTKENKTEKKGEIKLYYIDSTSSKIISKGYLPKATEKQDMVKELIGVLKDPLLNVLPSNVGVSIKFNGNEKLSILSVYYDSVYEEMDNIEEALCRAAMVKTLAQIPGVNCVEFYVNDQSLENADGNKVGLLYAKDFIETLGDETDYRVSLFFANKEGKKLVKHEANFNGNGTVEEWAIQQLINGPTESGMQRTIPEDTILLNIMTTKEGICTVDFNEKFLEKVPGIDNKAVIYSIVNTLVNVPNRNISKVQFLINGETKKFYREKTPFDGLFERNLSMNQDNQ